MLRATLVLLAVLLSGCTSNPYFIGAVGSGAAGDVDPSLSFAVDLDQSGSSQLEAALELKSGKVPATLVFQGEKATAEQWPSAQGSLQPSGSTALAIQLPAPFTDTTRAVGFVPMAPAFAASSLQLGAVAGDFALELVFKAAPGASLADKRGGATGWSVSIAADGTLQLQLQDDQRLVPISGEKLVTGAWYHCLLWASRSAGGRVYCNGREGALTDLSALGSLAGAATLTLGGGTQTGTDRSEIAYFSLFSAPAGGLGDGSDWQRVSRQRFAALTGVAPRVARGSPLPALGLRDSPAYLDLQRDSHAARQLFVVGSDWPRIACRSDPNGAHDCGYLSEGQRTRWVQPKASAWTASELAVAADNADFADGTQRMEALVPSASNAAHALTWTGMYGGARQALSFFARAETGQLVSASVSMLSSAVFDLRAGAVVSAPSVGSATIEDWGGGLFRCAYVFAPTAVATTYTVQPLADAQAQPFAGDGKSAWLDVAELQLDVGQAYPGSPLAADSQAGDALTFLADDGNLPSSGTVSQRLRVLLPAGPRLTDQAVLNLNRDGEFDNQVELYIVGETNQLKFWGLQGGDAHWQFTHPVSLVDGLRHSIEADWGSDFASLSVDGVSLKQNALLPNEPPFSFNRIDLGFSSNSSGTLEGLLAGLEIGAPLSP
jgi:hypothetical protein